MAFFGEMCAEDVDLADHQSPGYLEASARIQEQITRQLEQEAMQLQQHTSEPQVPQRGGRVTFRELL